MKNFNKKNFFLILTVLATVILGTISVITAIKIYELGKQPIAPNAPVSKPKAGDACRLTLIVVGVPTATPTGGTTPTLTLTPTASLTPIPPTPTSTPSYKPCFTSCDNDAQCESNLACLEFSGTKRCLNSTCPQETDCGCNRCWQFCTNDWECLDGLNCLSVGDKKRCVNRNCSSVETCTCQTTPSLTATPKPTLVPGEPTQTPVPTQIVQATEIPTQPATGIKTTTAVGILSGFLLLSFGLALIF